MIFFQNQCFLHKKMVSSMGTPLVSGKNRQTNSVMAATHPAKNTKIPYLKAQRSERNDCPIAKITICTPPAMSKALRPHLSTVAMEMKVEAARTPPVKAEEYSDAFDPKPIHVSEGTLDRFRELARFYYVLQLRADVCCPAQLLQHLSSFLRRPSFHQAVWGLREEDSAGRHYKRRQRCQAERDPPPVRLYLLRSVVYHVCRENP
nr:Os09g0416250 [Ipomoea batatas]